MRETNLVIVAILGLGCAATAGCGGDGDTAASASGSATSESSASSSSGGGSTTSSAGGGTASSSGSTGTGGQGGAGGTGGGSTSSAGGAGGTGGGSTSTGGAGGTGGGSTSSAGGAGGTGGGSTSSAGGAGGSGGSGGGGPVCTPEGPFDGAPISAPDGVWTWVPVPESRCRNGSTTGFGVRKNSASDKLFIYLEGGGACFNNISCLTNPSSYGQSNFDGWKGGGGTQGIFSTTNNANPVRDWNGVYIPYCTGDVHAGNAPGASVPQGPSNQYFVGYANIGYYLKRIIPTFPNVSEVLLTGISAGGFGAAYNYDRIAQAFCPKTVVLVDDSGPTLADAYLAPCLQNHWRTLWNLNGTMPSDCTNCFPANGGGIVHYAVYIVNKYPDARMGLISSMEDGTIRQFFGFGQNNCANLFGFAGSLPGPIYSAGLNDLRSNYFTQPGMKGTYYMAGTAHTYLGGNSFYTITVNGVSLVSWVGAIVNEGVVGHIGP